MVRASCSGRGPWYAPRVLTKYDGTGLVFPSRKGRGREEVGICREGKKSGHVDRVGNAGCGMPRGLEMSSGEVRTSLWGHQKLEQKALSQVSARGIGLFLREGLA